MAGPARENGRANLPVNRRALIPALSLALLALAAAAGAASPALSLGWYAAPSCDDAEAQNPGDPAGCRYDAGERECADGVDNDSDERADCLDADCALASSCSPACVPAPEICGDGVDQDCDGGDQSCCGNGTCDLGESGECTLDCGNTVCGDGQCVSPESYLGCPSDCSYCGDGACTGDETESSCAADCSCPWWNPTCWGVSCGDGRCEGGESCSDCPGDCGTCAPLYCGDGVCSSGISENCITCGTDCGVCPPPKENCGNKIDDDADGLADCLDTDCREDGVCVVDTGKGKCGNGLDDDGDGWIDESNLDDPDAPECFQDVPEDCTNGVDDDGDSRVDCEDKDCDGYFHKAEPIETEYQVVEIYCVDRSYKKFVFVACDDKEDNDGDGPKDCDDDDCDALPECGEGEQDAGECYDNSDNDNDGGIDCQDDNCIATQPECDDPQTEASCFDEWDDDNDGDTDCADSDCEGDKWMFDQGGQTHLWTCVNGQIKKEFVIFP